MLLAIMDKEVENYCEAFVQGIRNRMIANGKMVPGFVQFAGLLCRDALSLRFQVGNLKTDTAYTPDVTDPVHVDFVTFETTDEASARLIEKELRQQLRLIFPTEIQIVIADCAQSRPAGV